MRKCGIKSESGPDYLIIDGGFPQAASISTYDDHRMAMAFATLAAKVEGMTIESPSVVNKSFPNFWEILRQIGINGETVE